MKQLFILILFIFIPFNNIFSQVEFSAKIGLSSLQDLGIEASTPITEKKKICTSINYRYRSFYSVSTGLMSSKLVNSFNNNGFTIRLGIKREFQKSKNKNKNNRLKHLGLTSSLFFRRLEGIKDFRNSHFFGSNTTYKIEYLYQDFGFTILRERFYTENISSYLNFGFGIRKESNLSLKDFTSEIEIKPIFLFDIGIRLKLYSIN